MVSKALERVRGQTHYLPYPAWYWLRYAAHHAQIRLKPTPRRLGPVFEYHYAFQAASQWWDRERLQQYQAEQVQALVRHAYVHVPFHRRRFDEYGVRPEDIRSPDLLRRLPTMSKDDLRQHIDDLLATDRPRERLQRVTTGGTSGRPVAFFMDEDTYPVTLAYEWRQMNFAGHRFGERIAILRGSRVLRPVWGGRATWEYDPIDNALLLSSFDLTPENMAEYCKQLERFRPTLFAGYPSSLDLLARFMLDCGVAGPRQLRAPLTSSENLFPDQRARIEAAFGVPLLDKFGNSEQTCIAGQCDRREGYHVFLEYGVIELLDEQGLPVQKEGEIGEIVGTGFANRAMPLIRYRTEDFAEYTAQECSCGRKLPLLRAVRGRWFQEQIVARDGNLIAITGLNSHSDIFDHVEQFQYYQDAPGKVTLRLVPKPSFVDTERARILSELQTKIRDQIEIDIAILPEIPRTDRGKYRFLVQKLSVRDQARDVQTRSHPILSQTAVESSTAVSPPVEIVRA